MGPSADSGSGVVLVGGQLHHISGLAPILVNGLVMGMTVVLPRPGRWEPVKEIAERRVTAWSSVPSQFRQALDDPSFDPAAAASVSSIISAGAPLAGGLAAELRFSMPAARLANAYGMTETTGIGTSEIDPFADPASVGVPLPGCDVEIRKTSGELAAAGEMGEVHLRSSGVFLGYWADREATSRALAPGRWYRTGDFGSVAEGRLHLRSRMRDLIIRGGENIDPTEIEQRLIEHPDVLDVAVVGQDDETLGQVVKAVVVPRPGSVLDESAVKSWAGETMAAFKVPAWVEFRTSLPYTENGKVKKHELEKSTP
jgi:acyl-CoA synthetase (AMP-forming)/AMP-acid ligase II